MLFRAADAGDFPEVDEDAIQAEEDAAALKRRAPSQEFAIGRKHYGKPFGQVAEEDPAYCVWAMSLTDPGYTMQLFREYLESHPEVLQKPADELAPKAKNPKAFDLDAQPQPLVPSHRARGKQVPRVERAFPPVTRAASRNSSPAVSSRSTSVGPANLAGH